MTDVTWNPAGDDDTSFGPLTAHNVLGGRTAADAHPAAAVSYDNDVSGLTGDTVQEAIDELATSGGAVSSVNGETGVVVLDAGDVGAVPVESVGLLPGETNRGTWDVAATYAGGDVVAASGSVYVASAPSTGLDPASNPGSWDEIVDFLDRRIELGTGSSATGVGSTAIGYGSSATGDVSTAVGAYSSATTDGEVNLANIYRGSVDPGDPTVATGAEIATGFVDLPETSVVTDPAADHQRLIARTDGLYVRDQTGTEVGPLGAGGEVEPGMVPPVSPSAYDQEYWNMADGSPVVGTWHNQGTSSTAISDGRLLMTCQAAASGYNQRALLTTLPSFTSVTTRVTVGGELTNHSNAGLVLRNSGTGRLLQWLVHIHGPGKDLELHRANSFTSFDSATTTTGVSVGVGHVYLRMTSDGTNIRRWVSADGDRWIMVGSVTLASWIGSVTEAGVVVGQEHTGIAVTASFDFLRFT